MTQQLLTISSQLAPLLNKSQRIAVILAEANFDSLAAGLGLYLSLLAAKKEGNIFINPASNWRTQSEWQLLHGFNLLQDNLGSNALTIALNYPLAQIEGASSDDSHGRLELMVKLRPDAPPIRRDQVEIQTQVAPPEVGFLFGEETALKIPASWLQAGSNWLWFSHQGGEKPWARFSLTDPRVSYAEMVARLLQAVSLPFNAEVAKNLYQGIKQATKSFENIYDYRTLETAALCFKVFQGRHQTEVPEAAVSGEAGQPAAETIEGKEGDLAAVTPAKQTPPKTSFPLPKIFRGATTPKAENQ